MNGKTIAVVAGVATATAAAVYGAAVAHAVGTQIKKEQK